LTAEEFLRDLTKGITRKVHYALVDGDEYFEFTTDVDYADKLTKENCEIELLVRYARFIMEDVYSVSWEDYRDVGIKIAHSRIGRGSNDVNAECLKKLKDLMTNKNLIDYNKCIVDDVYLVVRCRKIKHIVNHFSDDGVINNDSFKEEREDRIMYKSEERARGMLVSSKIYDYEASEPMRVKTKDQYTFESISIEGYTETRDEFMSKESGSIFHFIRRSGVDFLQDKVFEINRKYSKEKTVKIYVDDKVVEELNIVAGREEVVDLREWHYGHRCEISALSFDKKIFEAKFVAKDNKETKTAELRVKILAGADAKGDFSIKLKTTKLKDRSVTL
jgi:hypothetical protein